MSCRYTLDTINMAPTTEQPRIFHVLPKKDGLDITFHADTICDVNGYGTYLRFKRDGKIVGEAQGDFHAWWLDDGTTGKTYRIEIPDADFVSIVADTKDRPDNVNAPARYSVAAGKSLPPFTPTTIRGLLTRQLHNLPVRTSVRPAEHEVWEP